MKLYATMAPEDFEKLDTKSSECMQIETITIENTVTKERRVFNVSHIRQMYNWEAADHRKRNPKQISDPTIAMFAVSLGEEIHLTSYQLAKMEAKD